MALPHCARQSGLPGSVELAETAAAMAVRIDDAMLLPQRLQPYPGRRSSR
jgi:hypothetical protein